MHHIDWHEIQKGVVAVIAFAWDHCLSRTDIVKANNTVELVRNGFKWVVSKFKKESPK